MATAKKKKAATPRQSGQTAAMGRRLTRTAQKGVRGPGPKSTDRNTYRPYEETYLPSYDRNNPSVRPPPLGRIQMNFSSTPSPTVKGPLGRGTGYVIRDWDNQIVGTAPHAAPGITSNTPYDDIILQLRQAGIHWADEDAPNTQLRQYMR